MSSEPLALTKTGYDEASGRDSVRAWARQRLSTVVRSHRPLSGSSRGCPVRAWARWSLGTVVRGHRPHSASSRGCPAALPRDHPGVPGLGIYMRLFRALALKQQAATTVSCWVQLVMVVSELRHVSACSAPSARCRLRSGPANYSRTRLHHDHKCQQWCPCALRPDCFASLTQLLHSQDS